MGSRRKKKVVAIDLDGTIIKGNSLHEYIKAGVNVLAKHHRYTDVSKVCFLLLQRRLKLISHSDMKFGCAKIIGKEEEVMRELTERTSMMKSEAAEILIDKFSRTGATVLVVTAAFDFYIPSITPYPFIATRFDNNPEKEECRGTRKAEAVKAWLDNNDADLLAVVTDHPDDLPLLELDAPNKYLINPTVKNARVINDKNLNVKILLDS